MNRQPTKAEHVEHPADWAPGWVPEQYGPHSERRIAHVSAGCDLAWPHPGPCLPSFGPDHPRDGYAYLGCDCDRCTTIRARVEDAFRDRDNLRFSANRVLADRPHLPTDDTRISVESATVLELLDAERQRDALLTWVRAHGVHSPFCAYLNPDHDCDCGLRAALGRPPR